MAKKECTPWVQTHGWIPTTALAEYRRTYLGYEIAVRKSDYGWDRALVSVGQECWAARPMSPEGYAAHPSLECAMQCCESLVDRLEGCP